MYQDPYGQNPYDQNMYGQHPNAYYPPHPGMPRPTMPTMPPVGNRPRARVQPRFFGFLLILAIAGAAFYLLLNGVGGSRQATAILQKENVGTQLEGHAVIVRDERLEDTESITNIDFIAEEGAMVRAGENICSVYSAGYNQLEIDRLNRVRMELQAYHRDRLSRGRAGDTQLEPIQDTIRNLTTDIRNVVQRTRRGSLINLERQLKDSLRSRQVYLRRYFPDDTALISHYNNEASQINKIESWTRTFSAHEESLVSFYTDGYENTVNAQTFMNLTPADVHNVLAGRPLPQDIVVRGRQPIYRTVAPDVWYVLLLVNDRDWNPGEGQDYKMQLEGFQDFLVDARVITSTRIGNEILVRLEVHADVRPVLNIRTTRMRVGEFVDGFSTPVEAVIEQGGVMGVVVAGAPNPTFVPVTVISQDQRRAYIRPVFPGSLVEGQRILTRF
ncbi:MAG: hypothetical protein FWD25_04530 [Clostridia bacterium]|nr:hypothetical protein [Clostridia bacterium]